MKEEDRGPWMETFLGKRFYPLNPTPEDISIIDIARGLSNQCRFNGHTKHFYSVAQHCIVGADWVFDQTKSHRWAMLFLLHDAAEAYIGDLIRPLKETRHFDYLEVIESVIKRTIYDYANLDWPTVEEEAIIKHYDDLMLLEEGYHLMKSKTSIWGIQYKYEQPEGHVEAHSLGETNREVMAAMYVDDFYSLYVHLFGKKHPEQIERDKDGGS